MWERSSSSTRLRWAISFSIRPLYTLWKLLRILLNTSDMTKTGREKNHGTWRSIHHWWWIGSNGNYEVSREFLTIIHKQNLLREKYSVRFCKIKGNETFVTEQIKVNTSWITTGKTKQDKNKERGKYGTRLSGCYSSESVHLALWAVKPIPLFQNNMQLCYPPTSLHVLVPRTLQ